MKRNLRHIILLFITLMFFNQCKLGGSYQRSDDIATEQFRMDVSSGESVANMPWWELFEDTVLQNMIEQAIENNLDLQAAVSRIRQAEAQMGVVRANLYPRVNYGGDGTFSAAGGSSDVTGSAFATASYTIDLWGRFRNLNDAALNDYLATEEAYRSLTLLIVSGIAQSYLVLRDLDNRLIISERTLVTWQENLDIVQARFNAGMISEVDLRQSMIQVQEAKTTIQTFTRLRVQTENAISILMGLPPQSIERGLPLQDQVFPPQMPTGLPSELLDRRPDLLVAERSLEAQVYRTGATEALQYPTLTLSADLGVASAADLFGNLSAQIFGPIFNSRENKQKLEIERERTEQLFLAYKNTYLNALGEVEDALIAVETYEKEFEARTEQVKAASAALELSWVRYESGLTSYLEILDLQRSEFSSLLKASEALQLQLSSSVQLYEALGGGWQVQSDTTRSDQNE